ncbi:uncharacterized protein LOC117294963 [Asterias rubens]|uniref:Corazonin-type peptide n=1 Tax=Asterias rubens TaxID=7604 RepID=A0A0U2PVB5_ASTRU|nr:uncharacterized protein LOC117294963 [Asterias rubens]ALJ99955.1 corazonin-type peptide precursor [Asterias rubens]
MGSYSVTATIYLALVLGSLVCSAHNTFTMGGQNRWKAGGKRSAPAGRPQQTFLDPSSFSEDQQGETTITLREMLVDMRDYCSFLLKLLDNVRLPQTERK